MLAYKSKPPGLSNLLPTFVMLRNLLYSSGFPLRFWSDCVPQESVVAQYHSVHPYKIDFSEKPDLSHVFSTFLSPTSRVSSARPAKLPTFHGVFLGYTVTNLDVQFYVVSRRLATLYSK
jgi:hypothetical protein